MSDDVEVSDVPDDLYEIEEIKKCFVTNKDSSVQEFTTQIKYPKQDEYEGQKLEIEFIGIEGKKLPWSSKHFMPQDGHNRTDAITFESDSDHIYGIPGNIVQKAKERQLTMQRKNKTDQSSSDFLYEMYDFSCTLNLSKKVNEQKITIKLCKEYEHGSFYEDGIKLEMCKVIIIDNNSQVEYFLNEMYIDHGYLFTNAYTLQPKTKKENIYYIASDEKDKFQEIYGKILRQEDYDRIKQERVLKQPFCVRCAVQT